MSDPPSEPSGEGYDGDVHPTDEEQVETEWHFWVLAILLVGGLVLFVVPSGDWTGLGLVLLGVTVLVWATKTAVERM